MHIVWNLSLLFSFPLSDYLQPVLLCVLKTFTSLQNRKKPSLTPYCPSSSTTLYFSLFRQTPLSSSATFTARALPPLTQQHHNSASSCSTAGLTKVSSDLHVNKSNECSQFLCNLILYLTLLLTTTLKLPWLVIFFVFPCRHLLSLLVRSATFNWSLNDGVPMTLPCPKHSPLSTHPPFVGIQFIHQTLICAGHLPWARHLIGTGNRGEQDRHDFFSCLHVGKKRGSEQVTKNVLRVT